MSHYSDVPAVPDTPQLEILELTPRGDGPIELEIGFGKGRFLLDRAANNPQTRFVGLETRRKWVDLVISRAKKREIYNVKVWHGDARNVLRRLSHDPCLSRVFINFPDPWWKARHAKRMVVTEELVNGVSRLLCAGGELLVQTDVDFRAEAYLNILLANQDLTAVGESGMVEESPFEERSLREMRCEEVGLPVYRLFFRRKKGANTVI